MLQFMIIIFIFAAKYSNYKTECSSHYAENTFFYMRLNLRGLTPSTTGMNDRQRDEKGQKHDTIKQNSLNIKVMDIHEVLAQALE